MAEDRFEKVRRLTREDREEIFDAAMERSDEIRNGAMCGSEEDDEESWTSHRMLAELRAEQAARRMFKAWLREKVQEARFLRWERGYAEMLDKLLEIERKLHLCA